ncbi:MAG: diacylglycerol kinase family protein [Bacillota bacterium]|nr:diacylglycerol kinase family protein [Bacillota bacterium]
MKTRSLGESFRCAVQGVRAVLSAERNMRIHFVAAAAVLAAAGALGVSAVELACLVIAIALVLICELTNTALELVCDIACPTWEMRVKTVKDIAAGTVLVSAVWAAVVGAAVLGPRLLAVARAVIGRM